ncbi:MAG: glycosyltransferase family 4 protein [Candidatus Micrarchaeota archaeon]
MEIVGLMAGTQSHYVHRAFFESVCNTIVSLDVPTPDVPFYKVVRAAHFIANFRRNELNSADVVLSESIYEYASLYKRLFQKNLKIIELFASPKIFKIMNNKIDPFSSVLLRSLIREVDAFLPVSQMCADFLRKKDIDKPIKVVHPFVSDIKYSYLSKTKYDANSKNIICIGNSIEYKGIDFLLTVFDALCLRNHDLRLRLVTKGIPEKYFAGIRNIDKITIGQIPEDTQFCDTVSSSLLAIHFGRYDTAPLSTLETMLAGVPTFVSEWTGTKEFAEKVDRRFVLPFDVEKSVDEIERFLCLSENTKRVYSKKFRELAIPFNKKQQVAKFKKVFADLASSL